MDLFNKDIFFEKLSNLFKFDKQIILNNLQKSNLFQNLKDFVHGNKSQRSLILSQNKSDHILHIVSPEKESITGDVFIFLRITNEPIEKEARNLLYFSGNFDSSMKTLNFVQVLKLIYLPQLCQSNSSPMFKETLQDFTSSLELFTQEANTLFEFSAHPEEELIELINSEEKIDYIISSYSLLKRIEKVLQRWTCILNKFLVESNQIRSESDEAGPSAEAVYWQKRIVKISTINECLKKAKVDRVVKVLKKTNSRVLQEFLEVEKQLYREENQAKSNSQNLSRLMQIFSAINTNNLFEFQNELSVIFNCLKLIFTLNENEDSCKFITTILVRITGVIVKTSQVHIMEDNESLWTIDEKRIAQVIEFNEIYQAEFFKMKSQLKINSEDIGKQMSFSENRIFSKIILFREVLTTIKNILVIFDEINFVEKIREDGIVSVHKKMISLRDKLISVKLNLFELIKDNKKSSTESFFRDYMNLKMSLGSAMLDWFNKSISFWSKLKVVEKCEKLDLKTFNIADRYSALLQVYLTSIEKWKEIFQANYKHPEISNRMPKRSGKIQWSRNILRKLEEIMNVFKDKCPILLDSAKGKSVIKEYNSFAGLLIKYELFIYQDWLRNLPNIQEKLNEPVLLKSDPSSFDFDLNFSVEVSESLLEVKYMSKFGFDIPVSFQQVYNLEEKLNSDRIKLEQFLKQYQLVKGRICENFKNLMNPFLVNIDNYIEINLANKSWKSISIKESIDEIFVELDILSNHIKMTSDIINFRVEENIQFIRDYSLVSIDKERRDFDIFEYIQSLKRNLVHHSEKIFQKSRLVEEALEDLLERIRTSLGDKTLMEKLKTANNYPCSNQVKTTRCEKCLPCTFNQTMNHYCQKTNKAVIKCLRNSLEVLKKLFWTHDTIDQDSLKEFHFEMRFEANSNRIDVEPAMEHLQTLIARICDDILAITNDYPSWNHVVLTKKFLKRDVNNENSNSGSVSLLLMSLLKPVNKQIADNKEIPRTIANINSRLSQIQEYVEVKLKNFEDFSVLLLNSTEYEKYIKEFAAAHLNANDLSQEFLNLKEIERKFKDLDPYIEIACLRIFTTDLKMDLEERVQKMLSDLSNEVTLRLCPFIEKKMSEFDEFLNKFSRPLRDLDDVRYHMKTLEEWRGYEVMIELELEPVQNIFNVITRNSVKLNNGSAEKIDTFEYTLKKINKIAKEISEVIDRVHITFKDEVELNTVKIKENFETFSHDYYTDGPKVKGITPREASDRLFVFQANFDDIWTRYNNLIDAQTLFGMKISDYPELTVIKKELNLLQKLYQLYNNVIETINGFYEIPWTELKIDEILQKLSDFQNSCRKLPKGLKTWQAFIDLSKKIDDFSESCPILEMMSSPALIDRHWERISNLVKRKINVNVEGFLLRNMMEIPMLEHKDEIEDICISAVKEKDIEYKLKKVIDDWAIQEFELAPFKGKPNVLIKGTTTLEAISLIEDSIMILSSLLSNRYNAPYKTRIQEWMQKLSITGEILEQWICVQNMWIYLEAVFVGGDIARQLPQEAKRFNNIDKTWQRIVRRAKEVPNIIQCCTSDDSLSQVLPHLNDQLEICKKSLSGYLENKRLIFPRFFFVSDPVLLEILGQGSDSHSIQNHLLSLFDNVDKVTFDTIVYDKILQIISKEGETIDLSQPVMAQGNVEFWIGDLLKAVLVTIKDQLSKAFELTTDKDYDLIESMDNLPAQIGLLCLQILWTAQSQNALENARFDKRIMAATNNKFLNLLNQLIGVTLRDLSKYQRTKFETLITIHVHQKDIFDEMTTQNIKSAKEFEWLKQTRFYYLSSEEQCQISICDFNCFYQNEFLGCNERLVITPLTDKCYITISQALNLSLGAAPAGPAGTGKTETVKDMGRCLGKYVVVFNCSDQLDYRGLGRLYKGLAQSGAWGCFDEFNRIDLPVLSVAAQQIDIVLSCKKRKKTQFIFTDGDNVPMNPEFGIFITMNPGYAGRQELPENLKINFRTVAMMVPDRGIIMRVKMASCGFIKNTELALKFFTLYKLCDEQLSKQVHYDFGLRNILSVLRTLGNVKRRNPDDSEAMIVMQVLKDMNMSKLVEEDEPLFMSLLQDLFPNQPLKRKGYPNVETTIRQKIDESCYVNSPNWFNKIIQLYETQLVRHGIMLLGPSGYGKSSCIEIMLKSLSVEDKTYREVRMNPKAITSSQMFGRLDVATNDWTDGIFSTLWRRTHKIKDNEYIWLVLDGPVDAIWIENLNSVLDDNKTLTLANGDRIPMAKNVKIVFEVHNIDNASPATVSRNGMIFMSSSVISWEQFLDAWLKNTDKKINRQLIAEFLKKFFNKALKFLHDLERKMDLLEINYIKQLLDIFNGLLTQAKKTLSDEHLERLLLFSASWSLSSVIEEVEREKLGSFLTSVVGARIFQEESSLFDYYIDLDNSDTFGQWIHWKNITQTTELLEHEMQDMTQILVPNVDNTRINYLLTTIAKQKKAVLLIGEPGTGKTAMVKEYLKRLDVETQSSKSINFSSVTTPEMFQRTIESFIEKRMGLTHGPVGNKKMTVFIDDISMPIVNEWGDQITNELTRQLIEMQGFYSIMKPGDFLKILDISIIGAMFYPGGSRNDIPERLKRQFTILNITLPSHQSLLKIFSTFSSTHFNEGNNFSTEIISLADKLVSASIDLWRHVKERFLPTPAKFHYIFSLRDLSRIWQGMLKSCSVGITKGSDLVYLWQNEVIRVLADKMTISQDIEKFYKSLKNMVEEKFGESFIYEQAREINDPLFFVNFMRDAEEPEGDEPDDFIIEQPKVYERVEEKSLLSRLEIFISSYNESSKDSKMNLVFFKDALRHFVRIARILSSSKGHALLVGVGGSGKQSLSRIAAFVCGSQIYQLSITRTYNLNNFLDDIRNLYRISGQQGKSVTLLITENDIKDETFLEYINNILSGSEIANLFSRDELSEIYQDLIGPMKKERPKCPLTNENLADFYQLRIIRNLHISLCFSPVSEQFRSRLLKFPGIISGCTIDWFHPLPTEALVEVSRFYIGKSNIAFDNRQVEALVQAMGTYHEKISFYCEDYFQKYRRKVHVTLKSFLSFLNAYDQIYKEKLQDIQNQDHRLITGLEKLEEASDKIAILSEELAVKEKELIVANEKAGEVLIKVTHKAESAQTIKIQVEFVKTKAETLVEQITKEKQEAEKRLESAKPALIEAEAALATIKPNHISTVRKLGRPPHLIMRIMDCVLILFQKKLDPVVADPEKPCCQPSWGESLKLMGNQGFLPGLLNFPKDTINDEMIDLMEPYFRMEDFSFENAKRVCGDVAGLFSWTKSMAAFYAVNKEVLPLKANLAIQENLLHKANKELENAQAELAEKQGELDAVQQEYDDALEGKNALIRDADSCKRKMDNATALINSLEGEKGRWIEKSRVFKEKIKLLIGDVFFASSFLTYLGPFNQTFRNQLTKDSLDLLVSSRLPFSNDLDLIKFLVENTVLAQWTTQGLPNDELSLQNGTLVTKAIRYPLLIDPQLQARTWIHKKESSNDLIITTLNDKYFRNQIEDAISLGKPLLIQDIGENIDPALDNVLEKNFIKSGTNFKVYLGDKEIQIAKGFRLYLTTKLSNPSYTPELFARVSIIDFTVTPKGLEDQLLGLVIKTEREELELSKKKLVEEIANSINKVSELEDSILRSMSETKGSLVDDDDLVLLLESTRKISEEVTEKLKIASQTEIKINEAREEYRPVANRGSLIYFLIVETSQISNMYQTSLKQFLNIFDYAMANSEQNSSVQKRSKNIIDLLTQRAHLYVSRGLYEIDKSIFSLLLALKISIESNCVRNDEFQYLLKAGEALDMKEVDVKTKLWIPDEVWLNLVQLSKLSTFSLILDSVNKFERSWKKWFESDNPEEAHMPEQFDKLGPFHRLLVIRCWCPDRFLHMTRKYIQNFLGPEFAEPVVTNLDILHSEESWSTPLLCLLSMGSDPTENIGSLAKRLNKNFVSISMGQGQEIPARRILESGLKDGSWVLLQNCHLSPEFMEEVTDKIISKLDDASSVNENFRLWITTEPQTRFHIGLLHISTRFTFDPPIGVRAGIRRTFGMLKQDQIDQCIYPNWKIILYTLAFMHTSIQERRKFGSIGWNIPYEFNQSDFSASMAFIMNHLDNYDRKKQISWTTIRYMIGEVHYGGRVTDNLDKRLLNTFTEVWFSDRIFEENFEFSQGYKILRGKNLEELNQKIEQLPGVDTPECFGLNKNADIAYQKNSTKTVIKTIADIQPKSSSENSGESREAILYRISDDLLNRLPADYNPVEVKAKLAEMDPLRPLNIFLRQEISKLQVVISRVRNNLQDLKLAIDGTLVMSEVLQDIFDNLFNARVPKIWIKISWISSSLGFWFTDLLERNTQLSGWLNSGNPSSYWLGGFFNPQGFITAVKQESARTHKLPLNDMVLKNEVTKMNIDDIKLAPREGIYLSGLSISGADWDRKNFRLMESATKALSTKMPIVYMIAKPSSSLQNAKKIDNTVRKHQIFEYSCPVYKNATRTDANFILSLDLMTIKEPSHWIMRGVALLCDSK